MLYAKTLLTKMEFLAYLRPFMSDLTKNLHRFHNIYAGTRGTAVNNNSYAERISRGQP